MFEKLILLGAGYLLGNPKAQKLVGEMATKGVQMGIDTLNNKPMNNVTSSKVEMPIEKEQE